MYSLHMGTGTTLFIFQVLIYKALSLHKVFEHQKNKL